MSTDEQINLADRIRSVHERLRRQVQQNPNDFESIWQNHLQNYNALDEYAQSMSHLAKHYWKEKSYGETRIQWCYETIKDYYSSSNSNSGLQRKLRRDERKGKTSDCCQSCQQKISQDMIRPKILDVGSCYNPFQTYDDLETIAIDIAPAHESVHRIDFLSLPHEPLICDHSFDSIILCLMLDYLPHAYQRLKACLIAHQLLRCLGVLLIVQADSSLRDEYQSLWRKGLQSIGFDLVSCNKKKNLYCMAFRKVQTYLELDKNQQEKLAEFFHIPQDIKLKNDEEITNGSTQAKLKVDHELFDELPFDIEP